MGTDIGRIDGESASAKASRLANEVYDLHLKYIDTMEKLNVHDEEQLALLAVLQRTIMNTSVHLARAVLNAKTEKGD